MLYGANYSKAQNKSFEIETDPTSFFYKRSNFNFRFSVLHWAIRLVPFKSKLPEFIHGIQDLKQNMIGVAFDHAYSFKENINELFVDPVLRHSKDGLENNVEQKIFNKEFLVALRIGYRINSFKMQRESSNGFCLPSSIDLLNTYSIDVAPANGNFLEYKQFQNRVGVHVS